MAIFDLVVLDEKWSVRYQQAAPTLLYTSRKRHMVQVMSRQLFLQVHATKDRQLDRHRTACRFLVRGTPGFSEPPAILCIAEKSLFWWSVVLGDDSDETGLDVGKELILPKGRLSSLAERKMVSDDPSRPMLTCFDAFRKSSRNFL